MLGVLWIDTREQRPDLSGSAWHAPVQRRSNFQSAAAPPIHSNKVGGGEGVGPSGVVMVFAKAYETITR